MAKMPKRVAILGSTGSIGRQALDVISHFPDRFAVVGLAAGKNVELLREQAQRFSCEIATNATDGPAGLFRVAVEGKPEIVLAATDGAVAFDAVFAAVERGIDIAVANKELIVAAGELLMEAARKSGAHILPVDSEHSAIFQCLVGEDRGSVERILLTASGGPFLRKTREETENATIEAALAHPTWRMGKKNTIDSATLMNKGLEVIEASRLFGFPGERIGVVVHPQSIVHGFVVFTDGSVKAQLAAPDMRVPIGYALAYPDRLTWSPFGEQESLGASLDKLGMADDKLGMTKKTEAHAQRGQPFRGQGSDALPSTSAALSRSLARDGKLVYEFEEPDFERFPCLGLAYEALERGGTAPAVLSAANEVAVTAFIEGRMRFGEIPRLIEAVLRDVEAGELTLEGVRAADRRARELAERIAGKVRI